MFGYCRARGLDTHITSMLGYESFLNQSCGEYGLPFRSTPTLATSLISLLQCFKSKQAN
jgi:hypothetical protein